MACASSDGWTRERAASQPEELVLEAELIASRRTPTLDSAALFPLVWPSTGLAAAHTAGSGDAARRSAPYERSSRGRERMTVHLATTGRQLPHIMLAPNRGERLLRGTRYRQ